MEMLDKLTIKGFKSIRDLDDFKLTKLNVIIGANGSGKSNLISFFKMLRDFIEGNLNRFVSNNGGIDDLLYKGRESATRMEFSTMFGIRGYRFNIVANQDDTCRIENEARYYAPGSTGWWNLGDSYDGTSKMADEVKNNGSDAEKSKPVYLKIKSWQIYHFHDTSANSPMRKYEILEDDDVLRNNASNIGPFLLKLKNDPNYKKEYQDILNAVRLVIPFFDDFLLKKRKNGETIKVNLSWTQKGSDYPMQPYHLSDGSIRFICLATALLQPDPPSMIIIDEPELGLHPSAIVILAELIQMAAIKTQIIIATQSPMFIDQFSLENIVVSKFENGTSQFSRLKEEDYNEWLEDYTIGELWTKNVISGGPIYG